MQQESDKWQTVERLRDTFERERVTGQLVIDFKDGQCRGGKQTTSF